MFYKILTTFFRQKSKREYLQSRPETTIKKAKTPNNMSNTKEKSDDIKRMINQYLKKRIVESQIKEIEVIDVTEDENGHYTSAEVSCPYCSDESKIKLNIDRSRTVPRPTISNFVSHLSKRHLNSANQSQQSNTLLNYYESVVDSQGLTYTLVYENSEPKSVEEANENQASTSSSSKNQSC